MEIIIGLIVVSAGLFLAFAMEGERFESTMEIFWDGILWSLESVSKLNPLFHLRQGWDEIDG